MRDNHLPEWVDHSLKRAASLSTPQVGYTAASIAQKMIEQNVFTGERKMNFGQIVSNVTRAHCAANGLPTPPDYDPCESDDDIALAKLTDELRDDLMDELRHESLAEIITQEHELHETDLYAKILVAYAMWNHKPETAYERMEAIDRLIYKAMNKIAERQARKALDL